VRGARVDGAASTTATVLEVGDPGLTNADLAPVPVEERRWNWWHFGTLWMGMVHNINAFALAGGFVALGFSVSETMLVFGVGAVLQALLMGLTGKIGARYGIPFAVWARSAFGVYGANVAAIARGAVAIGWFGVQSYFAATAINVMVGAAWPAWHQLDTVVAGLPINFWISMVAYWLFNFLVIRHGMETVRRFAVWSGPLIFVVVFVLLLWAIKAANGIGPLATAPSKFTTSEFLLTKFVPAVALFVAGDFATMVLNMPDLTRFARSNRAQFWGTALGLPVLQTVFCAMSALTVSATITVFHRAYWNPADILGAIGVPALSIAGAAFLTVAQLGVNVPANIVSPAYDLSNLFARFLTFRRAAALSIVLAFAYMPWRLMQSPGLLFGILNNIGAVLGPATGIVLADYFVVKRQRLDVVGLYRAHGPYRGVAGVNLAGMGVVLVVSGLLVLAQVVPGLRVLYENAWFIGLGAGFGGYLAVVWLVRLARGSLPEALRPRGSRGMEAATLEAAPADPA
jgi:nucleobase:cation symporter-1, NCS1 family